MCHYLACDGKAPEIIIDTGKYNHSIRVGKSFYYETYQPFYEFVIDRKIRGTSVTVMMHVKVETPLFRFKYAVTAAYRGNILLGARAYHRGPPIACFLKGLPPL